jgi:hypothetical protein
LIEEGQDFPISIPVLFEPIAHGAQKFVGGAKPARQTVEPLLRRAFTARPRPFPADRFRSNAHFDVLITVNSYSFVTQDSTEDSLPQDKYLFFLNFLE